jgi:hypothetical protein
VARRVTVPTLRASGLRSLVESCRLSRSRQTIEALVLRLEEILAEIDSAEQELLTAAVEHSFDFAAARSRLRGDLLEVARVARSARWSLDGRLSAEEALDLEGIAELAERTRLAGEVDVVVLRAQRARALPDSPAVKV